MKELKNYNSFIEFLKKNNLFNEGLPTKTIYRRLKSVIAPTIKTLTVFGPTTSPLLSSFSVLTMTQINNSVNIPFFGYCAISFIIKKEKGKFVAYLERVKEIPK